MNLSKDFQDEGAENLLDKSESFVVSECKPACRQAEVKRVSRETKKDKQGN